MILLEDQSQPNRVMDTGMEIFHAAGDDGEALRQALRLWRGLSVTNIQHFTEEYKPGLRLKVCVCVCVVGERECGCHTFVRGCLKRGPNQFNSGCRDKERMKWLCVSGRTPPPSPF